MIVILDATRASWSSRATSPTTSVHTGRDLTRWFLLEGGHVADRGLSHGTAAKET